MFRSITSFLLCAVLAFPWTLKIVISADFLIHQDYIAQNLCENRDKPELACNGQCVFMKKLQLTEESSSTPAPLPDLTRLDISSFLVKNLDWPTFTQALSEKASSNFSLYEKTYAGFLNGVFRPPSLV